MTKKKIPWGIFPFGVIRGGNGEELRMVAGAGAGEPSSGPQEFAKIILEAQNTEGKSG